MKYHRDFKPWGDLEVRLEQDSGDMCYYQHFTISKHMLDAVKYPRLILADCIREARQHIRKAIYDQQQQRQSGRETVSEGTNSQRVRYSRVYF